MDAKTMTMPNGDIINLMDEEARNLLGDETLDTTAQTCTGAINELKQSLDDKNSIVFSGSLPDVSVTSGAFVELKKVTVPTTGYYLVSGYHEWENGGSIIYADAINGYTQRNLSKGNGGGAFVTFVCRYNANDEIVYKTYLYSGNDTTKRGYLSVVKL